MKRLYTSLLMLILFTSFALGQDRVKERDVKGEWKMIIDIDYEEMEEDMEEDSWFGWVISDAVSGIVENVLDGMEIHFRFMDNGKLKVTVDVFGEEEVEYCEWFINGDGQLVIVDEDDDFSDEDEVWLLEGEDLISYHKKSDGRLERQEVFLKRM